MSTTPNEREAFEAWAVAILGDNPTWRESGPCALSTQHAEQGKGGAS